MSDALPLPPRPSLEQYRKLAKDFHHAIHSEDPAAVHNWAIRWVDEHKAARMVERWHELVRTNSNAARKTLTSAQFFLAREHGFASWPKFARHVESMAREGSAVSNFEAAADAIVNGDLAALRRLLERDPALARARSTRDHHSTLLHYVSANGVEDYRQKSPPNIVEITKLLLDAGADPDATSEAYGGGCTTVGLVATSVHPEQAGVQIALLETLLDRGAQMDLPGAAGNAHSLIHGTLANGQPAAARFLAGRGARLDYVSAAALGRLETLDAPASKELMEEALLYA